MASSSNWRARRPSFAESSDTHLPGLAFQPVVDFPQGLSNSSGLAYTTAGRNYEEADDCSQASSNTDGMSISPIPTSSTTHGEDVQDADKESNGRFSANLFPNRPLDPLFKAGRNATPDTAEAQQMGPPEGCKDIRIMNRIDRDDLFTDPKMRLYIGDTYICDIPWELFKHVSTKANAINASDPSNIEMHLPPRLSKMPFLYINEWLNSLKTTPRPTAIKPLYNLDKDLAICRAGRLLGMQYYIQDIHNKYWAYFKKKFIPDYAEVDKVLKLHVPGHFDPFLDSLAKRLAHLKFKRQIPDPERLENFLAQPERAELNLLVSNTLAKLWHSLQPGGRDKSEVVFGQEGASADWGVDEALK